jgi:hypothetical protein
MNTSLRKVLEDSHIGAVACLVLLVWSLDAACRGLWDPFYRASIYVATAIAIWDIPYSGITVLDKVAFISALEGLLCALAYFGAAWVISRWLFGTGPVHSLRTYRSRWSGRGHA